MYALSLGVETVVLDSRSHPARDVDEVRWRAKSPWLALAAASGSAPPTRVYCRRTVSIAARDGRSHRPLPVPHRQFSTRIETTAHQLNATNDYPPYRRYMRVHYDYEARRARIDYEPVPHMPPKSFVRRYDLGFEWMVMEVRHMIARGDAATPLYSF